MDVPLPTSYFDKPHIHVEPNDILLFSCLNNEELRLPYFLNYYRQLGVHHFFMIDNASTDRSGEYLRRQSDVHYFYTERSYRGSAAGRLWTQELAAHYGVEKWCLTVDVDELLVYPGVEHVGIREFCTYLDLEGVEGLFCVFLDMFSDKPLAETVYEPGEPFFEVCPFFEADTYFLRPAKNPPFLAVRGGPRARLFSGRAGTDKGPMMKKVPLVKWNEGFQYIFSTHSHKHITLSDVTGALLHFKFFEFFSDIVAREQSRGDRRQTQDYLQYEHSMNRDLYLYSKQSYRYESSSDFLRLGLIRANNEFRNYCESCVSWRGAACERDVRETLAQPSEQRPPLDAKGRFTIRWIEKLWPFVNNKDMAEHFVAGEISPRFTDRRSFLEKLIKQIEFMDIAGDFALIQLPEVLCRYQDPRVSLIVVFDGTIVKRIGLGKGAERGLDVDKDSLQPNVYKMPITWDAAGDVATFGLYVCGDEEIPEALPAKYKNVAARMNRSIVELQCFRGERSSEELNVLGLDGVVEKLRSGRIRGWLYDKSISAWNVPVAIYLNDRFAGKFFGSEKRNDIRGEGGEPGKGFNAVLPLGYFYERGETQVRIRVRAAGRNVDLRRSPVILDGGKDARWDHATGAWMAVIGSDDTVREGVRGGFKSIMTPKMLKVNRLLTNALRAKR